MRNFTHRIVAKSASDSSTPKTVAASCPEGERAVSGGASIERPEIGTQGPPPAESPAALQVVGDGQTAYASPSSRSATAVEVLPYDGDWRLSVSVVCVEAEPDLVPAEQ
jgi:hypothetical protein